MSNDRVAVKEVLDTVLSEGRTSLNSQEAKRVADAYGIPTPGEGLARSADEAVTLASDIGFPVVLKIVSPEILHKTDAGGVRVGIEDADAARQAYEDIVRNAKARSEEHTSELQSRGHLV